MNKLNQGHGCLLVSGRCRLLVSPRAFRSVTLSVPPVSKCRRKSFGKLHWRTACQAKIKRGLNMFPLITPSVQAAAHDGMVPKVASRATGARTGTETLRRCCHSVAFSDDVIRSCKCSLFGYAMPARTPGPHQPGTFGGHSGQDRDCSDLSRPYDSTIPVTTVTQAMCLLALLKILICCTCHAVAAQTPQQSP